MNGWKSFFPASNLIRILFLLAITGGGHASLLGQSTFFFNVRIVDGTGQPSYTGSVRVEMGNIVAVGDLRPREGELRVDGHGLVLTPGFIDSHSHHDIDYEKDRAVLPAISQGITTLVIGQDGSSHLPLGEYFEQLQQEPPALNVASYAGHNSIRWEVLGNEDYQREASVMEILEMGHLLEREMEAGALGLSTGLEYDPGIYSSAAEVLQLAKFLVPFKGRYISHLRSEDVNLEEAIEELLTIGKTTGIPVQISHFKIGMKAKWGEAGQLIRRLEQARSAGIQVTADVYPYTYWMSTLEVLFPKRDFDNRDQAVYALSELTTPEGMLIATYDARPEYVGKTIAQIAKASGEDPADSYLRLINQARERHAQESVIGTGMAEADIDTLYLWQETNVCSDGVGSSLHPRGYGTFPRFIRQYVREKKLLSLEAAVHKMTGLTASHLGWHDRGIIAPGFRADLVLWDPETITDHATTENPHAFSTGISGVWVNGIMVWEKGEFTGNYPGEVIRRH